MLFFPTHRHHFELFIAPRVHGLAADEGGLDAHRPVHRRTIHTNESTVVN